MSPFRRSVVADTKRKGKGGRGAWFEKMKLPQIAPTPFVLIKAEYADPNPPPELVELDPTTGRPKEVKNMYAKVRKHVRKYYKNGSERFPDEVCGAGTNPHNPQPCVGCFAMDTGDKSVSVNEYALFGLVHLAFYHGHPVIQNDGSIMLKKGSQEPVLNYDECEGRTCNYCRVMAGQQPIQKQGETWPGYDPRSITAVFGQRKYFELGKSHLSDLEGWDQVISSQCGNCRGQLTSDGFSCPYCNSLVIDLPNDPRNDEEIKNAVAQPYPCLKCGRPVLLRELVSCETCERQSRQCLQLGVFDVVLFGQRQGEGTKSHLIQGRPHCTVEEFAATIDPAWLKGKTMRQYIEEIGKPYDFAEMTKPRSPQDQAKRLDLPIPPGMVGAGPAGMPGQPQGAYAPASGTAPDPRMMAQPYPPASVPYPQPQPPSPYPQPVAPAAPAAPAGGMPFAPPKPNWGA